MANPSKTNKRVWSYQSKQVVESERSLMTIALALFTIGFFAWWIILGLAEADVIKNKKLTKWIGVDAVRGVKTYNVEDYYG